MFQAAGCEVLGVDPDPRMAGLARHNWRYDWDRPYTTGEWLDLVPTIGGYSHIPADSLKDLLTGLGFAVDAVGGRFTMQYSTVAVAGPLAATA